MRSEDCSWCGGSGRAVVEVERGGDDGCCLGVGCEEADVGIDCMFILVVGVVEVGEALKAVRVPVPVIEIVKVGSSSMSAIVVVVVVVVVVVAVVAVVVPMSVLLFVAGRTVESRVSKASAVAAASGRSAAASLLSGGGVVAVVIAATVTAALLGLASAGRSPLWWFRGSSWKRLGWWL